MIEFGAISDLIGASAGPPQASLRSHWPSCAMMSVSVSAEALPMRRLNLCVDTVRIDSHIAQLARSSLPSSATAM